MIKPASVDESVLQHLYQVFADDLHLCGCGNPSDAYVLIHAILTECGNKDWTVESRNALMASIGTPGTQHVVMSVLSATLLDHGTSWWSSWLTDKGRWVLWALNTVGVENLDDKLDHVGYPHYDDKGTCAECTDECWRIPAEVTP